ncbi:MAG: 7,8-didemethyl-8-hydroxy-5-deazariboflavin synthase subunit CofG [Methanotrichaceae archaeon]|nr:7,8-didemethyl-8-hydroxy-5-deazariboflavin synthase subunit CofG [Methanotrichaceae archaeon]
MRLATYSRNVFIPVTDLCRNRCGYCSFRRDIDHANVIKRQEALRLLTAARRAGCTEALFTLGDRPWEIEGFQALMVPTGKSDLIDYLVELCELALEQGLLPHTNAGLLSEDGLNKLAPYNASLGLMLETIADVEAHRDSPGKNPELRLAYLAQAGKLKIPFTTGILVGIGECLQDRITTLKYITKLHEIYDHVQEVIIQPLDPKPLTSMAEWPMPSIIELIDLVRTARMILPESIALQVPPNLVDPRPLLQAGADDLGGLSPLTLDWINPGRPWPSIEDLKNRLEGFDLMERLPIYPRYVEKKWYGQKTENLVKSLAGSDGLRRK